MKIPGRTQCNCFLVKYIHNAKTGKFNRKQYNLGTFERSKVPNLQNRPARTIEAGLMGRLYDNECSLLLTGL